MNKKISRRKMLKQIALSVSLPTSMLWFFGIKRKIATVGKKKIIIPKNLSDGITFFEDIIIKKDGDNIVIFSSSCTHLGCKIKNSIDDKLVCPCHGSQFNFDGTALKGPAIKPLEKLEVRKEKSTGELSVYV